MAERGNICRTITFCSNFIPTSGNSKSWDYIAIGTIDGIKVSDNIIEKMDKSVTNSIWREQKKFQSSLEGRYTAQQIFVVRYGDIEEDQAFWRFNEKYPFYFFCFCQLMGDKNELWDKKAVFEKYIDGVEGAEVLSYLTYDNTDLFIVIKAEEYSIGTKIINRFHEKVKLLPDSPKAVYCKNSYTVFAVNYNWLNYLDLQKIEQLNAKKIDDLRISIMERKGNAEQLKNYFAKKVRREVFAHPILGENDVAIFIKDLGWGDFLKLYRDVTSGEGELNDLAASISTLIVSHTEECDSLFTEKGSEESGKILEAEAAKKKKYISKICELQNKCQENIPIESSNDYGELRIILNALPKFTGEIFNDYIFYSLLKPIEVILEFTREGGNYNKEFYYEFISYLYTYIQTSSLSDKHTVQGLGFNSKIYDVPIKLSAFYNAFLYRMAEILKGKSDCEYVFLTVPGMQFNVNVRELYPNRLAGKRLILIKIPEASFYGMRDMMNILSHETAHYAGRDFRNRRERLFEFTESYVHIFVNYLYNMYKVHFKEECLTKEIVPVVEKRVYDLILLELEKRRIYIRNRIDTKEKKKTNVSIDYFAVLMPNITYAMERLAESDFELALAPIASSITDEAQAVQIVDHFKEIFERFMYRESDHSELVSSQSVLRILHSLYEECFADIMSILILGTSLEEYINCLLDEAKEQKMTVEDFKNTDVMFRIGTVILCLYDTEQSPESWREEWDQNREEEWGRIAQKAVCVCYGEEDIDGDDFEGNVYSCLANKAIFDNLYCYLMKCIAAFYEARDKMEMQQRMRKIQEIQITYRVFAKRDSYNAEEQIKEIAKVVEDYKTDFYNNLQ